MLRRWPRNRNAHRAPLTKERVTTRASIATSIAGLCLALASCGTSRIQPDAAGRIHGTITHNTDGDTFDVRIGRRTETIRLIGVNTPETKHPTKPVECWGPEASAHTSSLVPVGTDVWIVRDAEARDRYGRLLAYVYRSSDDLLINHELVAGGWGVPLFIPPNTAHEPDFTAAAASAEASGLGLWGHCPR